MKLRFLGVAAAVAALLVPATLLAASAGSNVTLAKGEKHGGAYYAVGQTVTVDGDVNGDVICAGQEVTINGAVNGDVICGAQTLTVNGPVAGSIRVAGQTVNLNSTVGRNVTAAAQTLELNSGAKVSGEIAVAGQTVVVNAPVAQTVYAAGQDLTLNSAVDGDVNAAMSAFHMGPNAKVAGSFTYTSSDSFSIDRTQVAGDVVHHVKARQAKQQLSVAAWLGRLLYWIVAVTASMLVAVWLVPRLVRSVTNQMLRRPQASFGWGALGIIVVPVVLFALMLTVIGIPLALILTALWVGILIVSGAFSGVALGQLILGRKTADQEFLVRSALIGVPLVGIALAVPWLGALLGFVGAIWVLGGVLLSLNRARSLG